MNYTFEFHFKSNTMLIYWDNSPSNIVFSAARVEDNPHSYSGIAVAIVMMIVAVAALVVFLFRRRPTVPVVGECTFDNTLYFNNPVRGNTSVDTKGLVANIEQNEHA